MEPEDRRLLAAILHRHREEIVDRATDWVIAAAVDLRGRRPRDETRRLVERVVACNEAALLHDDMGPLIGLVDFVTTFRAELEFHVSTLLRGFFSFRHALEPFLRADVADGWAALDVLAAVDQVYEASALRVADLYVLKLHETIERRRRDLEEELRRVAEVKARELEEKIATIEAQRRALASLSSPVLRVWEGVLVVPLVGEVGPQRAAEVQEKVLSSVAAARARALLIDVTGLTLVSAQVAVDLARLADAARLIGAEAMFVGLSAATARTLVALGADLGDARIFATLQDGLRAALEQTPAFAPRRDARGRRG